uniref:TLDc domain-containing protein n=1 Tax=Lotharella globosa TaxID=91324 RepID=A0A7S4DU51_9EUKA
MASRAHLLLLLQALPAPLLALTPASFRPTVRFQPQVAHTGGLGRHPSLSCPRQRRALRVRAEDEDPVTNFFTKIFGKNARNDPEPMGLKRATVEEFPDLWPPTQELGEVLADDPADVRVFRPLLKQTTLEFQPLLLAYDADRDGWSNKDFRRQMDGSYAAVLVGRTSSGTVFGAYNPAGWLGYGDFRECISAFLFTWVDGDTSKPAAKLPKVGGPSMAILDQSGKVGIANQKKKEIEVLLIVEEQHKKYQ